MSLILLSGSCQKRNAPLPTPVAPFGTITASQPFEKVSWDIIGPLNIYWWLQIFSQNGLRLSPLASTTAKLQPLSCLNHLNPSISAIQSTMQAHDQYHDLSPLLLLIVQWPSLLLMLSMFFLH